MNYLQTPVNFMLKTATGLVCRVHGDELQRIPANGPVILVANHINFLDAPIMLSRLHPRPVTGLAKVETWDNPLLGLLFNIWEIIPIRRGEADLEAFRLAEAALAQGKMLTVAPEGTRSGTGEMQKGKPGMILLALRSGAPILPLAFYGNETVWRSLRRLRRAPFHVRVGNPFTIDSHGQALSRDVREAITDEVMYQIAALLPPAYRGVYADLSQATENYLRFAPGVESNLLRANSR